MGGIMDNSIIKEHINNLFQQVIQRNLSVEALDWLLNKVEQIQDATYTSGLNQVFAQVPRMTSKNGISVQLEESIKISELVPGFSWQGWTIDRLTRVWLLLQVSDANKELYLKKINDLFDTAEMNELIALYSSLPFLSYATEWGSKCEEGIRSNIGSVLEAIMYNNPFPAYTLSESAWNQMVLKAFFTEKDMDQITGLKERANLSLANTLIDYVDERLAARRTVHPEIYNLIELGKIKK